uniref:Mitochondrial fission regulator n=1 Tax=Calidris pygmaea TaxID=425635 RepID=A0A8C3J426_9CHAR
RRLGTILSLQPYPRPYLQVNFHCWLSLLKLCLLLLSRTELWRKEKSAAYRDLHPCISIQNVPKNSTQKDSLVDQAALQKISALEDELTFLRSQIAAIVSAQTLGSIPSRKPFWFEGNQFSFFGFRVSFHGLSAPMFTPDGFYPVPAMTSTPLSVPHNRFVIPSPPPLPSGAPSGVDATNSAVELIKQRRAARSSGSSTADSADHQRTKNVPSMMDVLKDLNKVQLKAIERSPGGTPLSRPKKRQNSDWDPVALLTQALKRKFAHKNNDEDDSLDKENQSFDSSPFSSPEVSLVCFYIRICFYILEVTAVFMGSCRVFTSLQLLCNVFKASAWVVAFFSSISQGREYQRLIILGWI